MQPAASHFFTFQFRVRGPAAGAKPLDKCRFATALSNIFFSIEEFLKNLEEDKGGLWGGYPVGRVSGPRGCRAEVAENTAFFLQFQPQHERQQCQC